MAGTDVIGREAGRGKGRADRGPSVPRLPFARLPCPRRLNNIRAVQTKPFTRFTVFAGVAHFTRVSRRCRQDGYNHGENAMSTITTIPTTTTPPPPLIRCWSLCAHGQPP